MAMAAAAVAGLGSTASPARSIWAYDDGGRRGRAAAQAPPARSDEEREDTMAAKSLPPDRGRGHGRESGSAMAAGSIWVLEERRRWPSTVGMAAAVVDGGALEGRWRGRRWGGVGSE